MAEIRTHRTAKRVARVEGQRPSPKPRKDWYETFLEALRVVPVVKYACQEAGIPRSTAYEARQRDEDFALAWTDAIEDGIDGLEEVAHQRARAGQPMKKTVTKTYPDGSVETTVTDELHINDSLLMFVLKRHRPEYRESFRVERTGPERGSIRDERKIEGAKARLFAELDRLAASR
jgi:hypothetical protein